MSNNQVEINIYEVDENGQPIGSPLLTPIIIDTSDIQYNGFVSFEIEEELLSNTEYCIVAKEIVPTGNSPIIRWFRSRNREYIDGKSFGGSALSGNLPVNWDEFENKDFYFKIYYNENPAPVVTSNDIIFEDGNCRGCAINGEELTTRQKLVVVLIIDDSKSMATSTDFETDDFDVRLTAKKDKIKDLIQFIFGQTNNESYVDIWIYGRDIKNLSSGFSNNKSELLEYIDLLYNKGTQSALFDASNNAIVGLNYQTLIDAKYKESHEAIDVDIRWAKEFIPIIFLVTDGDATENNNAMDVALTASSTWDENGVGIICFGFGESHNQSTLRTIADLSGGKYFNINILKSD
jgi:hypothetical protein